MCALHIGSILFNYKSGELYADGASLCGITLVNDLNVFIAESTFLDSNAVSGMWRSIRLCLIAPRIVLLNVTLAETIVRTRYPPNTFGNSVSFRNFQFDLTLCMTDFFLQVFGGTISAYIGPNVFAFTGTGYADSTILDITCVRCHLRLAGIFIKESYALSKVAGSIIPNSRGSHVRATIFRRS